MHAPVGTGSSSARIDNGLLAILAVAAGLTVANNYYNQAMLGLLAHQFALSAGAVSALPVVTQLGNVAGILFLAPLGDRLERRFLILATMAALVVALVAAALAPGFLWLVIAGIGIGLFATVTQQIVPLAVHALTVRGQPGRRGAAELAGALLLALSVVYVVPNESLANWQSLWLCAAFAAMALTLLRAGGAPD